MKGFLITGTDTDVGKTWFMLKFGELLKEIS
jgi:dethiobiotin synthetase